MDPTPSAVAAIRERVANLGLSWSATPAELLAALEADTVPNPIAREQVAAPLKASDLLTSVSGATAAAILSLPAFDSTIRPLLDAPDPKSAGQVDRLARWAQALAHAGILTVGEAAAIAALLADTVPDPGYRDVCPAIELEIGRPIDAADIVASRPDGA